MSAFKFKKKKFNFLVLHPQIFLVTKRKNQIYQLLYQKKNYQLHSQIFFHFLLATKNKSTNQIKKFKRKFGHNLNKLKSQFHISYHFQETKARFKITNTTYLFPSLSTHFEEGEIVRVWVWVNYTKPTQGTHREIEGGECENYPWCCGSGFQAGGWLGC